MGSVQTLVQTPEFVIEEFPYNIDSSIRNISLNSSSKSSTTTDYVISMTIKEHQQNCTCDESTKTLEQLKNVGSDDDTASLPLDKENTAKKYCDSSMESLDYIQFADVAATGSAAFRKVEY